MLKELALLGLKQLQIIDPERHKNRIMNQMKLDLKLNEEPDHIECFDVSNIQGTNSVAACVVFIDGKPMKKMYRKFIIKTIEGPNDFGSMEEVIYRRYSRMIREKNPLPKLIIIDGGKGQLASVSEILEKFQLQGVQLIGIAKGISRRAGQETIFKISGGNIVEIPFMHNGGALNLLQQVRDEAHRFAITGHRQRRAKARNKSVLDDIPQLGPKRRKELLNHFGGAKQIANASASESSLNLVTARTGPNNSS